MKRASNQKTNTTFIVTTFWAYEVKVVLFFRFEAFFRQKIMTWLWGAPRGQPLNPPSRNWSQIFFFPKTTKYHQDSHVKGPAQFQTVNRSWVVFYPFWPAVPKPLTLGALSKGHPKYLFGATKWPPKHYGGASLTDPVAMGKITT